jgi:muconolactone D-isomerase
MEFLVEFTIRFPEEMPDADVKEHQRAEADAAAELVRQGHLVRLWIPPVGPGESKALGLYRADSEEQLDALLRALPMDRWMDEVVTPLQQHPNDPGGT